MTIKLDRLGRITNSLQGNHRIKVCDDQSNTGGFLIYEWWDGSNGPNLEGAFDSWVQDLASAEAYLQESQFEIAWQS